MKKYSVLMSLYKKEKVKYLECAIESMIMQSLPPDEIVIVKDGPLTEALEELINSYVINYPNLFVIVTSEKNIGLGKALNLGLKHCKNELVARMDTDDISKRERCEKQVKKFVEDEELDIVGSYIDEFEENIENIVSTRSVPCTSDQIYEFAKRRSAFNHPVVMYKKSKVLEQGGYADLRRNQDVDLFGRMLFSGCKAMNIDESLLWFRVNEDLAKRRKSWQNTWSYILTIYRFWKMGYSNLSDLILVTVSQVTMYLLPIRIQQYIYIKFLRKKI